MFDMMKMMGKVKEVQEQMKVAQENLSQIEVEGESGAGLVKATVNGKKQVLQINIDDSLIHTADKAILQDLVVAAVNKGIEEADLLAKEQMQKQTEGIIPSIPGFDLGKMFNG